VDNFRISRKVSTFQWNCIETIVQLDTNYLIRSWNAHVSIRSLSDEDMSNLPQERMASLNLLPDSDQTHVHLKYDDLKNDKNHGMFFELISLRSLYLVELRLNSFADGWLYMQGGSIPLC